MEIFFSDIPEEGLPFSGKLVPEFFNLKEGDSIRIKGDFEYTLTLYHFDDVVVMSGAISGPIELQCVTCLEYFDYQTDFPGWQSELDIEEGQVSFDPRESIRDEILLALPTTPHCDEMQENRECPKADLLADFAPGDDESDAPEPPGNSAWGALDQLGKEQ